MRWAGHVALMGGEKLKQNFVGKPEGRRPLQILRRTWENNMRMNLEK
jgi:hypothetical protein